MAHQVPWNKIILEEFIEKGCLTKDEEAVMRTRVAGWSRTKQAMEMNVSLATIDRLIASCKRKYDNIQKFDPVLPPRKFSAQETWMDEN